MKPSIQTALNKQINEELFSSYLYLSMAAYLESKNLKGCANWMRVQTKEENDHAMGLYNHLLKRGGNVVLEAIEKPATTFKDLLDIFQQTLAHEEHITACIHNLYELAGKEKDFALQSFLKWYVDEQVEEEANANELIGKIMLLGNKEESLYMLDKELAMRVYTPAPILGNVGQ